MKLRERKQQTEPEARELPEVLEMLDQARRREAEAEEAERQAKEAKEQAEAVIEDEFLGVVSPDEALRKRAFVERGVVEAERAREHAEAVVKAGEQHALKLVDAVHEARNAARQEEDDADGQVIASARAATIAAEARLQRRAEHSFAEERSHLDARRFVQAKSPTDWASKDAELIRKWIEGVRHQAAGNDDLPPRLRDRAAERLARLQSDGVSREYLQEVADRSGYTLLDPNGGSVRMPEA